MKAASLKNKIDRPPANLNKMRTEKNLNQKYQKCKREITTNTTEI
jgi:hypothetical protein